MEDGSSGIHVGLDEGLKSEMTEHQFIEFCKRERFEWKAGEHEGKPGWFVKCSRLDKDEENPEVTFVAKERLSDLTESQVAKFVHNGRDVHHMTRVVGYFSRVENWNKSKKGELRDRQKGDYSVEAFAHGQR